MKITRERRKLSIEELYGEVIFSNSLTKADRQQLKKNLLRESLTASEMAIIDRLLSKVRQGRLYVTD